MHADSSVIAEACTQERRSAVSAAVQCVVDGHSARLDLSRSLEAHITDLPGTVCTLTTLNWLELRGNRLRTLPDSLLSLTSLTYLGLSGNEFDDAPEVACFLPLLEELDLSENRLLDVPYAMKSGQCTQSLRRLDLRGNGLTAIETLWQLPNLEFIHLGANRLWLPDWCGSDTAMEMVGEHLTRLVLSGNALSTLPDALCELSALRVLDLFNNRLRTLPSAIGKLSSLRTLQLGCNLFDQLPAQVCQLCHLEALHAADNQLGSAPASLSGLPGSLRTLVLRSNALSEVPEVVYRLQQIRSVDLARNRLTELPRWIVHMRELRALDVSGNQLQIPPMRTAVQGVMAIAAYFEAADKEPPRQPPPTSAAKEVAACVGVAWRDETRAAVRAVEAGLGVPVAESDVAQVRLTLVRLEKPLPAAFGTLRRLRGLSLHFCKLAALPACVTELTDLETLDLAHTSLVDLPPSLSRLRSLTALSISRSERLRRLPPVVCELLTLRSLDVRLNGFAELPEPIVNLRSLHTLLAFNNCLQSLPQLPPALTRLDVSSQATSPRSARSGSLATHRRLQLPSSLGTLASLQQLHISRNALGMLPPALWCVGSLTELDLADNQLARLPEGVGRLSSLRKLALSDNPLGELPAALWELVALEQLEASRVGLRTLSPRIGRLRAMQVLRLDRNHLERLPASVGELPSIAELSLSSNQLVELPAALVRAPHLTELDVEENPLQMPPAGIAAHGLGAMRSFFDALDERGGESSNRGKLVLVGCGGAGKTSLLRGLQRDCVPHLAAADARTVQLDLSCLCLDRGPVGADSQAGLWAERGLAGGAAARTVVLSCWDLAGQPEYAAAQQPYLVRDALYLLVVPADRADDAHERESVDRWLDVLQARAPGALVQVVLSRVDALVPGVAAVRQEYDAAVARDEALFLQGGEEGAESEEESAEEEEDEYDEYDGDEVESEEGAASDEEDGDGDEESDGDAKALLAGASAVAGGVTAGGGGDGGHSDEGSGMEEAHGSASWVGEADGESGEEELDPEPITRALRELRTAFEPAALEAAASEPLRWLRAKLTAHRHKVVAAGGAPLRIQGRVVCVTSVAGGDASLAALRRELCEHVSSGALRSMHETIPRDWLKAIAIVRAIRSGSSPIALASAGLPDAPRSPRRGPTTVPPPAKRHCTERDVGVGGAEAPRRRRHCVDVEEMRRAIHTSCPREPPVDVDGVLGLLAAQGELFVSSGVVYLDPSFVVDLLSPLLHTQWSALRGLAEAALSERLRELLWPLLVDPPANGSADARELLGAGRALVDGTVREALLPLLWRDFPEALDHADGVMHMLCDSGVLFRTSHARPRSWVLPMRLQDEEPAEVASRWWLPHTLEPGRQQLSVRYVFWGHAGLPTGVIERAIAAMHDVGTYRVFWRCGALVVDTASGKEKRMLLRAVCDASTSHALTVDARADSLPALRVLVTRVCAKLDAILADFPGTIYDTCLMCPGCLRADRWHAPTSWACRSIAEVPEAKWCDACAARIGLTSLRHMLIVACSPNLAPLANAVLEANDLRDSCPDNVVVEVRIGGRASDLRAQLLAAPTRFLAFAGHADIPGPSGKRTLGFTKPDGGLELVEADELASMLGLASPKHGGRLELVFLNGCESADLGRAVRAAGVPCVVCWQTWAHDEAARALATEFFKRLHAGGTVRSAFAAAKHAVTVDITRLGHELISGNWQPSHVPKFELRAPTAPTAATNSDPPPIAAGIPLLLV